jgi:putative PIN family toxin of toxin-antitoxin system
LVTCPRLLAELLDVLARPSIAPRAPAAEIDEFLVVLADGAVVRSDPDVRDAWSRNPDDDFVVELARASGAHVLVTGDLDLLDVRGAMVAIRTPREFLTELAALEPD